MARLLRFILIAQLALLGVPATRAAERPAPPASLQVMTFNVRLNLASDAANAWPHRKELVRDVILEFDPAVLGVQEALVAQLDYLTDNLPNRASLGEARGGAARDEYSAIVYDTRRVQALETNTFWLSDTPDAPSASWGNKYLRISTWARLRHRPDNRCFYVYNTHFDHESAPSRLRSVQLLIQRISDREHPDEPVLLMGDFNAPEESAEIRLLTSPEVDAAGTGPADIHFVDTFRVLNPDVDAVGTFHGFTGEERYQKIDYIFAPAGTKVISAEIVRTKRDGRFPSDHYPVTAEVVLP